MKNTLEINFTTKEEYLQFVRDWKQQYKELSQTIRHMKLDYKTLSRPKSSEVERAAALKRSFKDMPVWQYYYQRATQKTEATNMLELRKAAKLEAQSQWLASHQAAVV